jgi:hypothetical protein
MNPPHADRPYWPLDYLSPITLRQALDLALNAAIFVPLGWGLRNSVPSFGVDSVTSTVVTGITVTLFSLIIEIVQHFLPSRYSSLYDVVANTAAALSALCATGAGSVRRPLRGCPGISAALPAKQNNAPSLRFRSPHLVASSGTSRPFSFFSITDGTVAREHVAGTGNYEG